LARRLAPEAAAELDAIWNYVARESGSVEIADRLIDSITGWLLLLADNPHLGRRREDDLRVGLRGVPVGRYLILYRIDSDEALILHVIPGARDIEALMDRR
jgi:toxin ParE1/3/4